MNCKSCKKEVRNSKTHRCTGSSNTANTTKLLPCKQCSKKFSLQKNLYQHIHSVHESNKAFQVPTLKKSYIYLLQFHYMSHPIYKILVGFLK